MPVEWKILEETMRDGTLVRVNVDDGDVVMMVLKAAVGRFGLLVLAR